MKFTLSWLKEHLDTELGADALAVALTSIGLEVESVSDPAAALGAFRVARVLTAERHPQADKLQVLSVDTGEGAPVQVVCGAPNARAGLVGVFGAPGTYVPGSDITLKVAAIRGVESRGMMCSNRELQLSDEHDGIIELAEDAPVGAAFVDYAGLADRLFDVSITPNRQDCMGVRGIARDLAAAGHGTLKPLDIAYRGMVGPVDGEGDAPDVRTDDGEGCPAFFAQAVSAVTNGPSPEWIAKRLTAIGQKPISALVDITNFVSVDLGRPLHVYDRATIAGALVARKARAGETIEALNGKTYTLDETMTVIADDAGVHDIGGIMGGAHSGVSEATTDVLIECAYFDPETIARTGQKLTLTSDARQRFERGVDPAFLHDGLGIATRLVLELCGGRASRATEAGHPPATARTIDYDPALVLGLGGFVVSPDRQREILERLGFSVEGGEHWRVTVPTWRRDVEGAPDLVEEVIRIEGIDKVPSTPLPCPPGIAKPTATPAQRLEKRVRRAAAARGLAEAVTWSFVGEDQAAMFGGAAWTLANPISEELKAMRPSLLPGLLAAARRNTDRGQSSVRLFEIGRRYLADAERPTLGFVLVGERAARGWQSGKAQAFTAFDGKSEVEAILAAAGAPVERLMLLAGAAPTYHPGRSGRLGLGPKQVLAEYGELHPATARALGIEGVAVVGELFLDAIPLKRATGTMRPAYAPPTLQSVTRDFAFLYPADGAADALVRAVRGADKAAITGARLFDRFSGTGVPDGQVSLAVEVTLQPADKSFTDAELAAITERIVAAAGKQGAVLRQ